MDNQLFLLLVARNLSGEATENDVRELQKFFDEDDSYKKKFDFFKAHWEDKNSVRFDLNAAFEKVIVQIRSEEKDKDRGEDIEVIPKRKPGGMAFLQKFSKIAAILFLCAGGGYFFYKRVLQKHPPGIITTSENIAWRMSQTPNGAKLTIILSDGSKVILNSASRLKFPQTFAGSSREVYLTGEAFFDVAKNAHMPFIIHTDKMNIKVLGTEFNVKSYLGDSASETTLIRGLIEVTLRDRPADRIVLRPREKLIVTNSAPGKTASASQSPSFLRSKLLVSSLHYISDTDSAVVETSWVDNKLVFQNESFMDLATDMERRYGMNIEFSNDDIKNYRFTGIFEKETIKEALNALKLTESFNYKIVDSTVYIF